MLNDKPVSRLRHHLLEATYAGAVFVGSLAVAFTLSYCSTLIGLGGGAEEISMFLGLALIMWALSITARRPRGVIILRIVVAYALVANLAWSYSRAPVDVKASCRTGWVGEECEDFMRDRAAVLPIIDAVWSGTCLVLLVALSTLPPRAKKEPA